MTNLILKDNKASGVSIITYPDGQHSVKLDLLCFDVKQPITIQCRIKNFPELEVLFCIIAALRKNDFVIYRVEFIYLFGMRSDRAFSVGEPNYFRDVAAPLINTMLAGAYCYVYVPHSVLSVQALKNRIVDTQFSDKLPFKLRYDSFVIGGDQSTNNMNSRFNFYKKREGENIVVHLDPNNIEEIKNDISDNILIVDDLCDGGATFIAEGKYLKELFPNKNLYLFVAHGIFSKGIGELLKYYKKIITTNSYQDFIAIPEGLEVINLL